MQNLPSLWACKLDFFSHHNIAVSVLITTIAAMFMWNSRSQCPFGQSWCFSAITAALWWWRVLQSNCNIEAFPPAQVVSPYYVIAVCVPSRPAHGRIGGLVCRTIMWDAFEWHPMSALQNTLLPLNCYLEAQFVCRPASQSLSNDS